MTKRTPAILISLLSTAHGATVLTEAAQGEFSDDYQNPTPFALMVGVNTLQFTIGGGAVAGGAPNGTGGATNGSDADFVFFDLPSGSTVTSILVTESQGLHFFGAQFGTAFDQQPTNTSGFGDSLDGQLIFGTTALTQELTRNPLDAPNALGMPSQDFVALFQETGAVSSQVTLSVTVVPEPSSAVLLFLASVPLLRRRRS